MKRSEKIALLAKAARAVAKDVQKNGIRKYKGMTCFYKNGTPCDFVGHVIAKAGLAKLITESQTMRGLPAMCFSDVFRLPIFAMSVSVRHKLTDLCLMADRATYVNKHIASKALLELAEILESEGIVKK